MERYYFIEFKKWIKVLKEDETLQPKTPKKTTLIRKSLLVAFVIILISAFLISELWKDKRGMFIEAVAVIVLLILLITMIKYEQHLVCKDNYSYLNHDTYVIYCKNIFENFKNNFKVEKTEHFEMILKSAEETREKIYSSSVAPIKAFEKVVELVSIPLISVILTKILDISFELRKGISVPSKLADNIQTQVNSFEILLMKLFWFFVIIIMISGVIAFVSSKRVSKDIKQYDKFIYYLKGVIEYNEFYNKKDDPNERGG